MVDTAARGTHRGGERNRRRSWKKAGWLTAAGLAFVLAVFYLGGGWYFSNLLNSRALDGEERRAALEPSYDFEVVDVAEGTLSLGIPADDAGHLLRPGVWGVDWETGYGLVSAIETERASSVSRAFDVLLGTPPLVGEMVEVESIAFPDPRSDELLWQPQVVTYVGSLGDYPAWLMPVGAATEWVVMVHGNSMSIADGAKVVPALNDAGYSVALVTYRNGFGAPEDPSGRLRYGATEWEDIEAAVQFTLDQGAERVVLYGFSMGGGIVTSFLYNSELADDVSAVVLDAPMLDFGRSVDLNAARESLPIIGIQVPQSLTTTAKWLASIRFGVDWSELDYLADAASLEHPILVIHGDADTDVPIDTSRDLATLRPDLVQFSEVAGAPHMGAWNMNPATYEDMLIVYLDSVFEAD